jgi:hypothetical protein
MTSQTLKLSKYEKSFSMGNDDYSINVPRTLAKVIKNVNFIYKKKVNFILKIIFLYFFNQSRNQQYFLKKAKINIFLSTRRD